MGWESVPEAEHEPAELIVRIPDGIDFWIPFLPPLLSNSLIESQYTGRFKVLSIFGGFSEKQVWDGDLQAGSLLAGSCKIDTPGEFKRVGSGR